MADDTKLDEAEKAASGSCDGSAVLVFGDIVENGFASDDNPTRIGIVVRVKTRSVVVTDGKGMFWDVYLDGNRLRKMGTALK